MKTKNYENILLNYHLNGLDTKKLIYVLDYMNHIRTKHKWFDDALECFQRFFSDVKYTHYYNKYVSSRSVVLTPDSIRIYSYAINSYSLRQVIEIPLSQKYTFFEYEEIKYHNYINLKEKLESILNILENITQEKEVEEHAKA